MAALNYRPLSPWRHHLTVPRDGPWGNFKSRSSGGAKYWSFYLLTYSDARW